MKHLCIALLLIFCIEFSCAQKQASQWYFGVQCALDFNSGVPLPILTGKLYSEEGCASIADKTTGNLLFYTDGTVAYDTNNNVMPSAVFMGGDFSTTQSAEIVPIPGSSNLYYVFTVDAEAGFYNLIGGSGGLNFNIVDMNLNGGLGDVTVQDSTLLTPTAEKCAVTLACNGIDYWVVAHQWNTDAFYSYLISSNGIAAPVISHSGIVQKDVGSKDAAESIGYMRISNDGKKLALACYANLNTVQVFDFDNGTGKISNPVTDTNFPSFIFGGMYGVCFSPDNSRLYVSFLAQDPVYSYIYQYDMTAGAANIIASRQTIDSDNVFGLGAIQQAPDGKLYIAKLLTDSLSAINDPDSLGAKCNFVHDAVFLGDSTKICYFGLPDILPNFNGIYNAGSVTSSPSATTICSGQTAVLSASGGTTYSWSPTTGLSSAGDSIVIANPTVSVTYMVTTNPGSGCSAIAYDTVTVIPAPNVPTISQHGDTLFSSAQTDNQWFLNDTLIPGATAQFLIIGNQTGSYSVAVTNPANGCVSNSAMDITAGIEPLTIKNDWLSIYPNPFSNQLTIITKQLSANEIDISNVLGQVIYKTHFEVNKVIDVSNLSRGIYFITVVNKGGQQVFKSVKE